MNSIPSSVRVPPCALSTPSRATRTSSFVVIIPPSPVVSSLRGWKLKHPALERPPQRPVDVDAPRRSEEHTSELQSLMRISYAVFCLKKKKINITKRRNYKY